MNDDYDGLADQDPDQADQDGQDQPQPPAPEAAARPPQQPLPFPRQGGPGDLAAAYGQAGGLAPPAPVQPPLPPTWTQADQNRLVKLQGGLSQAGELLDSGEIDQDTHAFYEAQITGQLRPLLARQKAFQAQQQQEAMDQLHQQAAMAAALQHTDSAFRAQGFPDTVRSFTDPLTGQTVHFYEAKPGQVRQIDMGDQGDAQAGPALNTLSLPPGAADQGTINYYPLGGMMQVGFGGDGSGQAPGNDATPDASGATPAQQQGQGPDPVRAADAQPGTPQPVGDGSHVMTIINGGTQERWHFGADGTTTLLQRVGPGEQQQQQASPSGLVSQTEAAILRARAAQVMGPPPQPMGNTPQAMRLYQQQLGTYQRGVNALSQHFIDTENKSRMQGAQQQAILGRVQGSQQAAQDLEATRQKNRKELLEDRQHQQESEGKYLDQYQRIEEHVDERIHNGTLTGSGSNGQPTRDEREQAIRDGLTGRGLPTNLDQFRRLHGYTPPGSQGQQAAPGGQGRQGGQPSSGPHLDAINGLLSQYGSPENMPPDARQQYEQHFDALYGQAKRQAGQQPAQGIKKVEPPQPGTPEWANRPGADAGFEGFMGRYFGWLPNVANISGEGQGGLGGTE